MTDTMQMIEDCEARESRMSEWETNFVADISNKVSFGRRLTEKQYETLTNIWEKVTKDG